MDKILKNTIEQLKSSKDLRSIKNTLIEARQHLEFEYVLFGTQLAQSFYCLDNLIVSDYPKEWMDVYAANAYMTIDPIVHHCCQSQTPYCWDNFSKVTDPDGIKMLDEGASYGLVGGVSVGMHNHNGATSIFTLASSRVIKEGSNRYFTASIFLSSLLPYLYSAVVRLSEYESVTNTYSDLTKREVDCLRWSAEGKNTGEIAEILSIKDTTVAFHFKNLMKKLQVNSRNQAISQAIVSNRITLQYASEKKPRTFSF